MPFTPAHAVVALPFIRSPLVPAAIAVGAMMPDLPLFFPVGPGYWVTHSWVGAFVADIPLALLLLLVWRMLLRPAVPHLTPRWLRERWPREWSGPLLTGWWDLWGGRDARASARVRAALLLAFSLLLGIATHIFWDEFTHEDRWGSAIFPQLADNLGPLPLTAWAQYASSVVALAIIATWGVRWLRRPAPRPVAPLVPRWFVVAAWMLVPAALAVLVALALPVVGTPDTVVELRLLAERVGKAWGASILVIAAIASLVVVLAKARHARDVPKFAGPPDST